MDVAIFDSVSVILRVALFPRVNVLGGVLGVCVIVELVGNGLVILSSSEIAFVVFLDLGSCWASLSTG